jgi:Ca-activated chloride channel family protein
VKFGWRIPALLAIVLVTAVASAAQEVAIVRPEPGEPVYGIVQFAVEIYPPSLAVKSVQFYLDYRLVDERTAPPWQTRVDVGQENTGHQFEVVVTPRQGKPFNGRLTTPAFNVDAAVDVKLHQLYVTVSGDGHRIVDLNRGDFSIVDGGQPQRLVTFARGDIPFTAVLLVDASSSMAGGRLATAVEGARIFARDMRPLDEAKLLLFSDRRLKETPFTNLGAIFALGLEGLSAGDGTALNDMLYLAYKRVERRQGRKVIVLLSDGIDVDSVLSMDDVATLRDRVPALVYWIRLAKQGGGEPGGLVSTWRGRKDHAHQIELLERTVHDSGGRILSVNRAHEIGPAFSDILAELRAQYALGYYPQPEPPPGVWRPVEVRISRPGLAVRAPRGYRAEH